VGYILTQIIAPGPGWGPIPRFLDVDREVSVPTWFSSIQLFAVAVVLLMQGPRARQLRFFLLLLGIGFLFLSMDEAAGVHDSIRRSTQRLELPWLRGINFVVWMALYTCIGLVGLLTNYHAVLFAWRHFRREVVWVAVGGAVFVAGGIGGEALSGYLWRIAVDERFFLAVAVEEFLEMAGVSIMLYGFMLLGIRIQLAYPRDMPMAADRAA
jgi:hypothetical protein